MGILNLRQFTKSYMLEFLRNGCVEEVFTFSVPPQSEELDFPQRVVESKTFGGSIFDKYGNDTIRITLSGTTGNEECKLIYRGLKKLPRYWSGEKEIFELQKTIYDYHKPGKDKGLDIYLYDLSKMNMAQLLLMQPSKNWWKVVIKDFKIKRDDSKPQFYNYTLEMAGVVEEGSGLLAKIFDEISEIASMVALGVDAVKSIVTATKAIMGKASRLLDASMKLGNDVLASPLTLTKSVVDATGAVVSSTGKIVRTAAFKRNPALEVYNGAMDVAKAAADFANAAKQSFVDDMKSDAEDFAMQFESKEAKIESVKTLFVSFASNGGSAVQTQTVKYSEKAARPEDPERAEHEFECWCSDEGLENEYDFSESEVTENITLYARWRLVVATVTFNTNFGSAVRAAKVSVGERLERPENPTKKGFVFKEWCVDAEGIASFDFSTSVETDMTLYAAWSPACMVTFVVDGGEVFEQSVKIGGLAVYPLTPKKDNFTFSKWCVDAERAAAFDFSMPVETDMTLYALFVQTTNTVVFKANGGSETKSQEVKIGGFAERPEDPEREGFNFVRWCDDKTCTNEFLFDKTPVNSRLTLYADWAVKRLLVSFDTDGGSRLEAQSVVYMQRAVFPPIPEKDGCVFEMWRTREEMKTGEYEYREFDFGTELTGDVTLYAKWFGGEK